MKKKNIDEKLLVELYNLGYGTLKLAKKFKLHRATIQRYLLRNNIKLLF